MEVGKVGMSQFVEQTKPESQNDKHNIDEAAKKVAESNHAESNQKVSEKIEEQPQEEVHEAVEKLNDTVKVFNYPLRFQVHDETERTMVSVVDIRNDEIIRQIPSEEALDMVAKINNYMGIIFDKKA